MKFKVHFTIKRDNLAEEHSAIVEAETPAAAAAEIKAQANGETIIIKKTKVVRDDK